MYSPYFYLQVTKTKFYPVRRHLGPTLSFKSGLQALHPPTTQTRTQSQRASANGFTTYEPFQMSSWLASSTHRICVDSLSAPGCPLLSFQNPHQRVHSCHRRFCLPATIAFSGTCRHVVCYCTGTWSNESSEADIYTPWSEKCELTLQRDVGWCMNVYWAVSTTGFMNSWLGQHLADIMLIVNVYFARNYPTCSERKRNIIPPYRARCWQGTPNNLNSSCHCY